MSVLWKELFDSILPEGTEFVWEDSGYEKFLSEFIEWELEEDAS